MGGGGVPKRPEARNPKTLNPGGSYYILKKGTMSDTISNNSVLGDIVTLNPKNPKPQTLNPQH